MEPAVVAAGVAVLQALAELAAWVVAEQGLIALVVVERPVERLA